MTTSSCSGRIAVFKAPNHFVVEAEDDHSKGVGHWLLASHAPVTLAAVQALYDTEVAQAARSEHATIVRAQPLRGGTAVPTKNLCATIVSAVCVSALVWPRALVR